jgi:ribosome-associated toxin RatA of RatAB toxin-antitoxin module
MRHTSIAVTSILTAATLVWVSLGARERPAWARPNLPAASLQQLEQGKTLEYSQKVPGTGVMMGKSITVINDVPEAVAWVFLDLDKYKYFLPRIKESRVVKRPGWHTFAVVETDLPWPVKDCWAYVKFTRYNKPGRVYEIKWWMINGTMKSYTGHALIEPWNKEGTRSVISYQLLAEPKTSAPDSMISDGVKEVASVFVDKLRLRIQALRKFKKMPKGM